jgi:hypothetical protein
MEETKNKVGRPRKYTNVDELQELIDNYFKTCDEMHRPYTMTGLALFLDMDRRTLLRYEKEYTDEFCLTITRAKERVQEFVECCLFKKGIAQGVIFNLKNNFGWEDKQEVDHTVTEIQKNMNAVNDIASQMQNVSDDDIDVIP